MPINILLVVQPSHQNKLLALNTSINVLHHTHIMCLRSDLNWWWRSCAVSRLKPWSKRSAHLTTQFSSRPQKFEWINPYVSSAERRTCRICCRKLHGSKWDCICWKMPLRAGQEGCQASDHSLSLRFSNCKLEIKETSGQFPAMLQPKPVFLIRGWEVVFVATQQDFKPKQDLFPTLRFLDQT